MALRVPKPLPPVERLRQVFDYNPETGVILWRRRPEFNKSWNARNAGFRAGCIAPSGYMIIRFEGQGYFYHRIAWAMHHGQDPGALLVDHANCDPLDNRAANLRHATRSQNNANQKRKPGKILPKGVKFDRARGKFKAMLRVPGGKRIETARYDTPEAAHAAYCALAVQHHGEFARFE